MTATPRSRATSSTPRWIDAKNSLATSSTSRPTVPVRWSERRRLLAVRFGR